MTWCYLLHVACQGVQLNCSVISSFWDEGGKSNHNFLIKSGFFSKAAFWLRLSLIARTLRARIKTEAEQNTSVAMHRDSHQWCCLLPRTSTLAALLYGKWEVHLNFLQAFLPIISLFHSIFINGWSVPCNGFPWSFKIYFRRLFKCKKKKVIA